MLLKHKREKQNTSDQIQFINNIVREIYSELNQNEQDTLTKTAIAINDDLIHRRCSQYQDDVDFSYTDTGESALTHVLFLDVSEIL